MPQNLSLHATEVVSGLSRCVDPHETEWEQLKDSFRGATEELRAAVLHKTRDNHILTEAQGNDQPRGDVIVERWARGGGLIARVSARRTLEHLESPADRYVMDAVQPGNGIRKLWATRRLSYLIGKYNILRVDTFTDMGTPSSPGAFQAVRETFDDDSRLHPVVAGQLSSTSLVPSLGVRGTHADDYARLFARIEAFEHWPEDGASATRNQRRSELASLDIGQRMTRSRPLHEAQKLHGHTPEANPDAYEVYRGMYIHQPLGQLLLATRIAQQAVDTFRIGHTLTVPSA